MQERKTFLESYGNLFTPSELNELDNWADIYTDPVLFWRSQYARSFASCAFSSAMTFESCEKSWMIANNSEAFAKLLEGFLIVR